MSGPQIRVIPPEEATDELKSVYEEAQGRRGTVANVLQIHSLQPKTLKTHLDLYLSILYGASGLSRQERETIAVAVSRLNDCGYCVAHHADALGRYQKDARVIDELRARGTSAGATARERALIDFSRKLTATPQSMGAEDTEALRAAGLNDEEILMGTLTAAYFNFVNRVVLGLGVELETERNAPYNY